MSFLVEKGILKNETESASIFESLLPNQTFLSLDYATPQDYVAKYWNALQNLHHSSYNGQIFELIVYTLLYREKIRPFYTQAKVAFVPNVTYDTILYRKSAPIALSLKASLRERYKQADFESIALKYVHRKAQCYLLTMNNSEANVQKRKIENGEIIGIDQIIDCTTVDINNLINFLKAQHFSKSVKIKVVNGLLVK